MRKKTLETWLFQEAMRLANTDKRSVKSIIEKNWYRADMYLAFYKHVTKSLINLKSIRANEVNMMIIKLKLNDKELIKEFDKAKELYKNSILMNKKAKQAIIKLIKEKQVSMSDLKKVGIQQSNYYKFKKNDYSALSLDKAKLLFEIAQ